MNKETSDDVKIKVIDSDKLINAINKGSYEINLSAVMALGAVMSDRWVPCSERLPKKPFKCLLTIHTDGEGNWVCPVAHVWNGRTWNDCNGVPIGLACFEEIIAWMPLPEPYQKGADV